MPRRSLSNNKKRVPLELSEKARQNLDDIQQLTDADSRSEVLRNSLNLYYLVAKAKNAGGKLILRDEKGDDTEIELV